MTPLQYAALAAVGWLVVGLAVSLIFGHICAKRDER